MPLVVEEAEIYLLRALVVAEAVLVVVQAQRGVAQHQDKEMPEVILRITLAAVQEVEAEVQLAVVRTLIRQEAMAATARSVQ